MTPEELFTRYSPKAREIVQKLCWYYQCSGALQYQDEAHSEGQMALWQFCERFDPSKQAFQLKKERQQQSELIYSLIFNYEEPEYEPSDPYANFWMLAVLRVKGAVIDFFRAERLITKRSLQPEMKALTKEQIRDIRNRLGRKEEEQSIATRYGVPVAGISSLKPTMFYREKFVSLDRQLSDFSHGSKTGSFGGDSFLDVLPAPDVDGPEEERQHIAYMVGLARQDAELTRQENQVVDLCFSDADMGRSEVAKRMKIKQGRVDELLRSAIGKMRENWPEILVDEKPQVLHNGANGPQKRQGTPAGI